MKTEVKLTAIMALATAGLMTFNYMDGKDVPTDTSPSSQPAARNQYLIQKFPQLATKLNVLPIDLTKATKVWKEGRNEWHSHYDLGQCSKLPQDWYKPLMTAMGKNDRGGIVQTETANDPIYIHVKAHPDYVHIFATEYNPSKFAEKAWYKSWMPSASDVKSGYVMAITCESNPSKDRAP